MRLNMQNLKWRHGRVFSTYDIELVRFYPCDIELIVIYLKRRKKGIQMYRLKQWTQEDNINAHSM